MGTLRPQSGLPPHTPVPIYYYYANTTKKILFDIIFLLFLLLFYIYHFNTSVEGVRVYEVCLRLPKASVVSWSPSSASAGPKPDAPHPDSPPYNAEPTDSHSSNESVC